MMCSRSRVPLALTEVNWGSEVPVEKVGPGGKEVEITDKAADCKLQMNA